MGRLMTGIGALLAASSILHAQTWERSGDVIYSDTFTTFEGSEHSISCRATFGPLDTYYLASYGSGGGHVQHYIQMASERFAGQPLRLFKPFVDDATYPERGYGSTFTPVYALAANGDEVTAHVSSSEEHWLTFGSAHPHVDPYTGGRVYDVPVGERFYQGFTTPEGRVGFVQLYFVMMSGYDDWAEQNVYYPVVRIEGWALWDEAATGPFIAFDIAEGPIIEPVYCAADINQDGVVDFGDFGNFVRAFDSVEGDPNWDAASDIDQDGDVDFGDFGAFVSQFDMTTEECEG